MADTDTPATDTPAKKPVRRRSTTPAKAAAATRTPRAKAEPTAAATPPAVKKTKAPPKPRSSKRTPAAATPRKAARTRAAAAAGTAADKVGGKWGVAAIAGGLAVAGATAAALLSLRGSTPKPGDPATPPKAGKAHQPDGTDSSRSFAAGIADENTIPD